jgi:triosephosphate isomerase
MNKTPREAAVFASDLLGARHRIPDGVSLALAPAFPALDRVSRLVAFTSIQLAAQDVHTESHGAFTGEVSAAMLKDVGVSLAIVGHSERRRDRREDEGAFTKKMRRLVDAGIGPLYCVGETLEEREGGKTEDVLTRQMTALDAFATTPPPGLVIAYEPVWAIGTGRAATPDMANDAHRFIRKTLADRYGEAAGLIRILYGGSVTPAGAPGLFRMPEIDGGLVGGASLVLEDFLAIAAAAGIQA